MFSGVDVSFPVSQLGIAGKPVRIVTTDVNIDRADYLVVVVHNSACISSAFLPANPTVRETHVIKDGKGDAASNNITVVGSPNTIDGASTFVMNSNYQAVQVTFTGLEWSVI